MTTEIRIRLQCIDGCGAAVIVSVPVGEESLCDRIDLPVEGNVRICHADGHGRWLEWICEDCVGKERMTEFVRKGI